jgi:aminomethyltransferase
MRDATTTLPPHWDQPLLKTPFHERMRAFSQHDAFIPWAGYTTVDYFTTVEQEYFAIRNQATLFDLTPMVKYRVAGPDAERYLNRLVTRDVRKLKVGRVAYSVWCNDHGHIIDDGTIFRFGPDEFRVCTAERQIDWFLDSAVGFDVVIEEVTEQIAALALQGPTSFSVLKAIGLQGIETLKVFELRTFDAGGFDLIVSRTGFTGDLGYEIWMAPERAEEVFDRLVAAGKTRGIRMIGSAALDMVRIEAGFVMPNVDFISAEHTTRVNRDRSPYELGLDWLVDLDSGHFNGRRALLAEKQNGSKRKLVGLDIAGNKPAYNALVYADHAGKKEVGSITSALWSPTCKRNIGFAMVEAPWFDLGRELYVEIYLCRELVWERRWCKAKVVDRVFFSNDRRRATPPADK